MSYTRQISVKELGLNLRNFRTVPQSTEIEAIHSMIAIGSSNFWALMESLIESGYIETENIIILESEDAPPKFIVKEGNRRVACLKIIHGIYEIDGFGLPENLVSQITNISSDWISQNTEIPCLVFPASEEVKADRIVNLAHGKGEKAARDKWTSVARARHNRDFNKVQEPALDLLEKYLTSGKNLTGQQKERWAGDYPLTILDEAVRIALVERLGAKNNAELANKYPKIKHRDALESVILNIGLTNIKFKDVRDKESDFASIYGFPPISKPEDIPESDKDPIDPASPPDNPPRPPKTPSSTDPRAITKLLNQFSPRGNNREKVVSLRDEMKKLKVKDNPLAFCFLLRSSFEISAKVYCEEKSIALTKKGGSNKTLVELLREVTNDLTNNNKNTEMTKVLHGALVELGKPEGILSVTSMNQLVHNPKLSIQTGDICLLFGNVYPLLEAMN